MEELLYMSGLLSQIPDQSPGISVETLDVKVILFVEFPLAIKAPSSF